MKKLNARWFPANVKKQGDKAREDYEKTIRSSVHVLERLAEIVQEELDRIEFPQSQDEYDCPSWSHKQADRLGQLRAYRNIMSLLKLTEERPNA
jgi:hypothetical protein